MKRSWTSHRATLLGMLSALVVSAFAVGCAGPTPPPLPQPDESMLSAAGFKVVIAKTTQQHEHLQSLPAGQLTAMERNGTPFFIYPDVAKNQIYVGTRKEYQAYQRLRPENTPNLQNKLNSQQAADMASYLRQDDAMRKANTRDLSDPYYFWPSFGDLSW